LWADTQVSGHVSFVVHLESGQIPAGKDPLCGKGSGKVEQFSQDGDEEIHGWDSNIRHFKQQGVAVIFWFQSPNPLYRWREMEVMRWVREGKLNGEIPVILGLGAHTVRKHPPPGLRSLQTKKKEPLLAEGLFAECSAFRSVCWRFTAGA